VRPSPGHPELAFDFLAVNDRKWPYELKRLVPHVFVTIPVTATYAWAQPVFAPLDGTVVAYSDGNPDRERTGMIRDLIRLLLFRPQPRSPFSAYGGNYVILKCGEVFPLFAHLRNGSVRVRAGDAVRTGDQLGEVGNSGVSLQPHLHFQIMSSQDPFPLFKNLLPVALASARKRIGKEWKQTTPALLKNGDHLLL
jgi:murein DD-endopeptidase MepM/ murein hydrolase activator NlpD